MLLKQKAPEIVIKMMMITPGVTGFFNIPSGDLHHSLARSKPV
ncbi:hypothetical protein GRAQ_00426 [Rahnella aquatilis CIP 78.65 = ATCC 33071]|nr:hypothetical protein GRAQ_00426 [Rahnella aquatilis CIP 78.65 = ATCC 33071]